MRNAVQKLVYVGSTVGALALSMPVAQAQEFFFGAGYGRYDINDNEFDQDDKAWKLFAGFNFNQWFGIEATWVDFNEGREAGNRFEADGWGAAALFTLPLTQSVALTAKAGQFFWDASGINALSVRVDDDGNDPFYGAGVKFKLGEPLDLRLEWERFDVVEADVDFVSASLQFSF